MPFFFLIPPQVRVTDPESSNSDFAVFESRTKPGIQFRIILAREVNYERDPDESHSLSVQL